MLPFLQLSLCSSEQGCCVIRLISPDLEEKVEIYFRTDGWKTASIIQQFEAQKLPSKRDVKNALQLSSNRNFPSKSHRFHLPTEISRPLHTVLYAKQKFPGGIKAILPPNRNFPSVARGTLCQTEIARWKHTVSRDLFRRMDPDRPLLSPPTDYQTQTQHGMEPERKPFLKSTVFTHLQTSATKSRKRTFNALAILNNTSTVGTL